MKKTAKHLRKLLVYTLSIPLFILGIILIPLPGPGILISFLALLLLSTESDWAHTKRKQLEEEIKKIYKKSKQRADDFEKKYTEKWENRNKK